MFRFYCDTIFFSFFFSILFCVFCSLVDNLLGFWVFLELCGISLIPSFFCVNKIGICGFYRSLLSYIVMSGLSSVFMISGLLFVNLYFLVFFGFVVKFGLFPFSFWVYRVFVESTWSFIFLLSVVLKFPILFFCFLFQGYFLEFVYVDCFLTMIMCGLFFWFFRVDWEYIWCHISLSSVSTLMIACFCRDEIVCFFIYFYYFIWGLLCITYFMSIGIRHRLSGKFWLYCVLLLVTPVSFPLFYKLGVCFAIFYSSIYVLIGWCVYRFSEQYFLYKLAGDYFYSDVCKNWMN